MAYELDQFISDCRNILTGDPGPKGREEVRVRFNLKTGEVHQMTPQIAT
jgi:hypothetical protein